MLDYCNERLTFGTMAKASNSNLHIAKRGKNDEFYTQLTDIEKEMAYYLPLFQEKTVLCNCDDLRVSNFFRYFFLSFHSLGLKKLIATCYKNLNPDLFSQHKDEQAVYCIYDGKDRVNDQFEDYDVFIKQNERSVLKGDGDFRSEECIELLKQADIVVTNPPFSLFREYVAQLIEYDKKFLIVGNVNAITYKECFKWIKEDKMWLGASIHSGDREFAVPDSYPLNAAGYRVDENGKKFIRVKGVRWFTNLDFKERHRPLPICERYTPEKFPKYDNYDAVEVSETADIPEDYDGIMGVPITFLDKYCPDQFEILAKTNSKEHAGEFLIGDDPTAIVNGKKLYHRLLIRRKKKGIHL
ncbi:MAG: adenine-specific methyltransferase EcoRI family protein [Planctomycetaceae bacterium]|nr:adenine-specific methyltransferase EcoRI family protein [Planctomycetaceae bacterium]